MKEGREFVEFKGIQVPIFRNRFGEFTVSVMSSLDQKKFFFTEHHGCNCKLTEDWVPITSGLPHNIVPRPRFPKGRIETIQDLVDLHHSDEELTTYEEVIKDPKNLRG